MPTTRTKQDARFWSIVQDLEWRLDDGSGSPPPPPTQPEFDRGGNGGVWPSWSTHLVAFILGGLTWGVLLLGPVSLPLAAVGALGSFTWLAVRRRWR